MLKFLSFIFVLTFNIVYEHQAIARQINPDAKSFKYSTTIEKERPQLDKETKRLIAAYRKNPTEENYAALRRQTEKIMIKLLPVKRQSLKS